MNFFKNAHKKNKQTKKVFTQLFRNVLCQTWCGATNFISPKGERRKRPEVVARQKTLIGVVSVKVSEHFSIQLSCLNIHISTKQNSRFANYHHWLLSRSKIHQHHLFLFVHVNVQQLDLNSFQFCKYHDGPAGRKLQAKQDVGFGVVIPP